MKKLIAADCIEKPESPDNAKDVLFHATSEGKRAIRGHRAIPGTHLRAAAKNRDPPRPGRGEGDFPVSSRPQRKPEANVGPTRSAASI
ncbi:MAG: hypothetical protein MZV70_69685 [Desulfobacterales bacterium]|nr:hypothetical protein [Desulfobacterales bacterium]